MDNHENNKDNPSIFAEWMCDRIASKTAKLLYEMKKDDEFITIPEAAQLLHISVQKMYRYKEKIGYKRAGIDEGRVLFRRSDILQLMRADDEENSNDAK